MGTADRERSEPPVGALLVLLLVVAGVAVQNAPLDSGRPKSQAVKAIEPDAHRADARLWQDPFGAIPSQTGGGSERTARSLEAVIGHAIKEHCRLDVLGAMVFGGPYEELAERRRRSRYAVVSALNAIKRYPDNPEKIGYLTLPMGGGDRSGASANGNRAASATASKLPRVLPFELFVPETQNHSPVLLLWIDESWMLHEPLPRLEALREYIDRQLRSLLQEICKPQANEAAVRWRLLGPASSTMLQAMQPPFDSDIPFFSGEATWYDRCADNGQKNIGCPNGSRRLRIVRTIADDLAVSRALVRELNLRQVFSQGSGKPATVALISDIDTSYGRALPEYFKQAVRECRDRDFSPCIEPKYIEVGYLRTMDGALAAGSRDDSSDRKSRDSSRETDKLRLSGDTTPEHAEGNAQLDYLRRLAADLQRKHKALLSAGEPGIRAIGVLGSDVYDKLMLLRALRPLLPEALYFTVDLDARMLDADQVKWSRNLIVASSLGLKLHPRLQDKVPPFRDSYQTATYLATIASLSDPSPDELKEQLRGLLKEPRVFEIGTRAFPLVRDSTQQRNLDGSECSPLQLTACRTLHPAPAEHPAPARVAVTIVSGLAVAFAFVLLLCMKAQSFTVEHWIPVTLGSVVILILPVLGWFWFERHILSDPDQEPFTFLGGISVWPSTLIRLLALLVALVFLALGWWATQRRLDRIQQVFFPGIEIKRRFTLRAGEYLTRHRRDEAEPVDTCKLWEQYLSRRHPAWAIACVVFFMFLLYATAWMLVALDHPSATPCRGTLSCATARGVLFAAVFIFLVLLGLVVRETNLCQRFIRALYTGPLKWPAMKYEGLRFPASEAPKYRCNWLGLQLVAKLTAGIGALIYGPFLVILLLIVARSSVFDQWHLTPSLLSIFALCLIFAAIAAIQMRRAAEHARTCTLESMRDARRLLAGNAEPKELKQLDALIEDTRSLSTGAFRPFFQQPLVRAALLPLGGYGGVAVLEYLALFSQ